MHAYVHYSEYTCMGVGVNLHILVDIYSNRNNRSVRVYVRVRSVIVRACVKTRECSMFLCACAVNRFELIQCH